MQAHTLDPPALLPRFGVTWSADDDAPTWPSPPRFPALQEPEDRERRGSLPS